MNRDSCFQLGYLVRPHGLKGEIKAIFESDDPQRYNSMESVFVDNKQSLVPFFIESVRTSGQYFIIKFEGIGKPEEAEHLLGCGLWLPLEFLPELPENQFYFHEIIGYTAVDKENGVLGTITDYYSVGPQELLSIDHNGKEILVPMVHDFLIKLDKKKQVITFDLPEGLIDLYTDAD